MSGEKLRASHLQAREPFPPADDVEDLPTATSGEALEAVKALAGKFDSFAEETKARFGLFHEELALLRAAVLGDHAPRITAVEKRTLAQKVAPATVKSVTATLVLSATGIAATVLAKHWPWLQGVADAINGAP